MEEYINEKHTFYLPKKEYCDLLCALSEDTKIVCSESTLFARRILPISEGVLRIIELYLKHSPRIGNYVVVVVVVNGEQRTASYIKDITTERLKLVAKGCCYDIGIDIAAEYAKMCKMFDVTFHDATSHSISKDVLAKLYWPGCQSFSDVGARWLLQQRAMYLHAHGKLWFSFDGDIWEPFARDGAELDGDMVTVYRALRMEE